MQRHLLAVPHALVDVNLDNFVLLGHLLAVTSLTAILLIYYLT